MSARHDAALIAALRENLKLVDGTLYWATPRRGYKSFDGAAGWLCHGYRRLRFKGQKLRAHHVVWAITYGRWPVGELDHINGNKLDNRPENLREATRAQNMANCGPTKRNTSGYRGVSWHPSWKKWVALIRDGKRLVSLGGFETPELAYAAYVAAAHKYKPGFTDRIPPVVTK